MAALALLLAVPAQAQVSIHAEPGFGGIFRLGEALPVRIELVNSGAAVRGVLEVVEARGGPTRGMDPYSFIQQRDLFLSAHARKVLFVTVDPDTVAQPLVLRFTGGGQSHETAVTLRGRFTGQPLLLLLTRSNVAPAIPLPYETPVPVVSLPLSDLPEDARAYGGVWSVILYEQSLRGLSRRQRAALERWLSSGGTLAVLGGAHFALYRDRATAPLLPVAVRGVKRVDALPELSAQFGGTLADLLVQDTVAAADSTVLVEEGGTPILVQRDHGAGRVTYLSLDVGRPPVSDWEGLPALFGEVLGKPPPRGTDPWSAWNRSVFTVLLQDFGFSSLRSPILTLLLALALYIGSLLLWFRYWRSGVPAGYRLALVPAALVAASALAGYWYFDRGGHVPDGILISSTVVESSPWSDMAPVHANVGLFATRHKDFSFSLRDGWSQLDLVPASVDDAEASLVLRQGRPHGRVHVPLTEWNSALFKLRSLEPSPVGIDWQHTADTYRIGIANRGSGAFTDCWLVVGGKGYKLGDVPPGGVLRRELSAVPKGEGEEESQPRDVTFDDDARRLLLRYSVFPDNEADDPKAAFVIGWIGGDEPALQVDDARVSAHHFKLFRVALPVGAEEEDL
ncbi:MAG: hypothetical protein OXU42_16015 [Deltaproteobacteria bacterium]|nr:hypothetical protein [Deltaproteobacteria bacterium]